MANSPDKQSPPPKQSLSAEERKVIFASSLGTVFEWYDFYLYGTLATLFAESFFPPGNDTAALLSALATYAAGFLVRPFGALVFGRIGDLVGRKYTFLVTISVMGISTFGVGCLPKYETIGIAAPLLLTLLRLLQGLALGGEYGGAVIYVAEHTPGNRRGYSTSWIQTTATAGFFLSLVVIGICRKLVFTPDEFTKGIGWRVPFWFSLVLLGFSLYIRVKLHESPVFLKMKSEARTSKHPLRDSFLRYPNVKYVVLALFGAVAGQGVVWYTGQFYALVFLQSTLHLDYWTTYIMLGIALFVATPMFVIVGRLSDRVGRVKIIALGCLLAAVSYFSVFHALTRFLNPELDAFREATTITVAADNCETHLFPTTTTKYSECDSVRNFFTKRGLSFESKPPVAGKTVVTIGDTTLEGWHPTKEAKNADPAYVKALADRKFPDHDAIPSNYVGAELLLIYLVLLVTLVYGPIAALLVELFPANIRYTSMSLPYHLANGWIGGLVPLIASVMAASSGNIFYGLWYPIVVAALTLVIGLAFLRDAPADFDINK
jgi:MFS family permease